MRTRIHINLEVADLDRSVAFYETLLGAPPSKTRTDYANWRLDAPGLHLALVHRPGRAPVRSDQHFGIELFDGDALAAWQSRVEAAGLAVRTEESVTCCYAVADKFWARDPDGNEWEFWVRSAEAEAMSEAGPSEEGACCAPTPDATSGTASACCPPAEKPRMPLSTIATLRKADAAKAPSTDCCG